MEDIKEYEIEGKIYVQKKMVWGQIKQLIEVIKDLRMPDEFNTAVLIAALGEKAPMAMAVIVTEKGCSPKDKDLEKIAEEFQFSMQVETAVEIIDDFFGFNPTSLWLEKALKMVGGMQKLVDHTGSMLKE